LTLKTNTLPNHFWLKFGQLKKNGTVLTVQELKQTLRNELQEIESIDTNDAENIPDEISSWQEKLIIAKTELANNTFQQQNLTITAKLKRTECDKFMKDSVDVVLRLQRVRQEVEEENQIYLKEKSKYQENVDAIEKDVEILNKINDKLVSTATEAAKNSDIDPLPIQHQVNVLVSSLQNELEGALSNLRLDWKFTELRLNASSSPVREEYRKSQQQNFTIGTEIEDCQSQLSEFVEEIHEIDEQVKLSKQKVANVTASLEEVKPAFEKRHQARVQRLEFLENTLKQLEAVHPQTVDTN